MANKIITIDAGHGLYTAGKQTLASLGTVYKEWTLNDKVVRKVMDMLNKYEGIEVHRLDDTTGKTDVSLANRVSKSNSLKAHVHISVHQNAGGGTGTEVYWHTYGTTEDKKLAGIVAPKLATKTGLRNRGVKQAQFAVLGCKATAILIEGGFMDTLNDYKVITSDKGQQAYAEAVVEGLVEYLGLKKKQTTTSQPTTSNPTSTTTSSTYKVGDKIKVKTTATHYATGQSMASFVKGSTYEVTKVDGNKLLLSSISSWVWDYDVEKVGATTTATPKTFKVRIKCAALNIRKSADFNSAVVGTVEKGEVYTIVEEKNGLGKLKSGAGFISMGSAYVEKI